MKLEKFQFVMFLLEVPGKKSNSQNIVKQKGSVFNRKRRFFTKIWFLQAKGCLLKDYEIIAATAHIPATASSAANKNISFSHNTSSCNRRLLRVRQEIAQLVGFETFAHRALQSTMAKCPDSVLRFLHSLTSSLRPVVKVCSWCLFFSFFCSFTFATKFKAVTSNWATV